STGNKPKLLLDAHIDRVGLIVSFIDDNGFIKVGAVGGPDRRVLAAQSVTIHGKEKVKGVVSVLPPQVKSGDGVPKIEEIVIDTGYTKQELESRIELGDRITFDCEPVAMLGTRYCAGALDDRCGVAYILAALEMLKSKELAFDLDVSFTAQEETGESGAKIAV
ncbi:M42 family peptidase, partial [[Eubacterium] siraeum]|nr:M42 family peptidase [[Eubacterium] siraeum]